MSVTVTLLPPDEFTVKTLTSVVKPSAPPPALPILLPLVNVSVPVLEKAVPAIASLIVEPVIIAKLPLLAV